MSYPDAFVACRKLVIFTVFDPREFFRLKTKQDNNETLSCIFYQDSAL